MKTKIQIKTFGGSVLFEFETEENSISKTIVEAVKSCANLSRANLSDAKGLHKIIQVGPIGSRQSYLCALKVKSNSDIIFSAGCFQGTVNEFMKKVIETHKGNKHEKDYRCAVDFILKVMGE